MPGEPVDAHDRPRHLSVAGRPHHRAGGGAVAFLPPIPARLSAAMVPELVGPRRVPGLRRAGGGAFSLLPPTPARLSSGMVPEVVGPRRVPGLRRAGGGAVAFLPPIPARLSAAM